MRVTVNRKFYLGCLESSAVIAVALFAKITIVMVPFIS